jgi:hypothetical protein
MKQSTIKKYIQFLTEVKNSGKTLYDYCNNKCWEENGGLVYGYKGFVGSISSLKKEEFKNEEIQRILDLYYDVTNKKKPSVSVEQIDTDDRAETSIIRGEDGKIQYYSYQIFRKNKAPLSGKLTREEMNTIHRLYSYYGDSLTQRVIARHFVDLSLVDFKRILRAFNITKASAPFAPHYFEELSEEELREIQLREKENSFLRKAEEDQIKNTEKLLKKYAQENIELKNQLKDSQFTVNLNSIDTFKVKNKVSNGNTINLYLADMHIGASINSSPLYGENLNYNTDEIIRRLKVVLTKLSEIGPFKRINLVLLGDNIDCCGIYGKTSRLDHDMPENMDPREQANNFISILKWFVQSLLSNFNSEVYVYSVPCGNHAGNYEYICNKALFGTLNAAFPEVKTELWEEFYGVLEINDNKFICCHGKEQQFMKKPMPLDLNDKTKIMLYEWLDSKHIYGDNIHFIKGDLHSNALSSCKKLSYRNVLSLFGASDYSNYNYSRNSYGVSYDLFINNNLIRGTFENI